MRELLKDIYMIKIVCDCWKERLFKPWEAKTHKGDLCLPCTIRARAKHSCSKRSWRTKEYEAWVQMNRRCYNKSYHSQHRYRERGIWVCDMRRWENWFMEFYKYMWDAPSKEHSLDRIDNNKWYEPWNIRRATKKEQSINSSIPRVYKWNSIRWRAKVMKISEWVFRRRIEKYWYAEYVDQYILISGI